jgi:membrane fusion protein (multidrug efflux system)
VQTEVTAGSRIPGKIEILEGLERGDQVIVHGLMQVRSGQEISIRAVEDGHRTLDRLLEE